MPSKTLATDTLNGAISTAPAAGTSETWTVTNTPSDTAGTVGLGATAPYDIKVDSEICHVTSVNVGAKELTLSRGYGGTTPATHSNGATVVHIITGEYLNAFALTGDAPATHAHVESDVTSLVSDLAGKAATSHAHAESDVTSLTSDLALKAPLASPALTGTPTAPTAAPGTNTTQVATTAFAAAIGAASIPESQVTNLVTDLANKAALAHTHVGPVVDIVTGYGADPTGVADSTTAINNAIAGLPATGGVVYCPAGDYRINGTITIGNGTTSAASTRSGVFLCGAAPAWIVGSVPRPDGQIRGATRLFSGTATTMVQVNGPLSGWGISDLQLDGLSLGTNGILEYSCMAGDCSGVLITNFTGVGQYTHTRAKASLPSLLPNHMHNVYRNYCIYIPQMVGAVNRYGILSTGDADALSNSCYDVWDGLTLVVDGATAPVAGPTYRGIYLQAADNQRFRNLHFINFKNTSGGTAYHVSYDYSINVGWPADCHISTVDFGTTGTGHFINHGSPSGTAPNYIYGISATNGQPTQTVLTNLVWGSPPSAHAASHVAAGTDPLTLTEAQITNLTSDLALKAPLASPTFTTSLIVPISAGAAPTADGSLAYDSTQDAWKGGGAGALSGNFVRVLSVQRAASDTLSNGVTTEQDFATTFTIPANYFIAGRAMRVNVIYGVTMTTAGISHIYKMRLGSTPIYTSGTFVPPATAVTNKGSGFNWIIQGTAAAGASVATETGVLFNLNPTGAVPNNSGNQVSQPVNIATNAQQVLTFSIQYGSTGGAESVSLRQLIIEELR